MKWQRITGAALALLGLGGTGLFALGLALILRQAVLGLLPLVVGAFCTALALATAATNWFCNRPPPPSTLRHIGDLPGPSDIGSRPTGGFAMPPVRLWLEARLHGHRLPLWELCSMIRRGTPARIIVEAFIILGNLDAGTSLGAIEDIYITEHHRIHDAFDLVHIILGVVD